MRPFVALFLICIVALGLAPGGVFADTGDTDTIDELKQKIEERNQAIDALEKEIASYQSDIENVGNEAKTLQSTIKGIDLEQKKLNAEIRVTEAKISRVTLLIKELGGQIAEKEEHIGNNQVALAEGIRAMNIAEEGTLLEALLSEETLSAFWQEVDTLKRFQESVRTDLQSARKLKTGLETNKTQTEKSRAELVLLRRELSDRTTLLAQNRRAKNALLAATKNKEAEYRKLLAQKVARRDAFEQELLEFESQLKFAIDPASLPKTGSGVLNWPLALIKITQYFGSTAFALAGAYQGKGHNGIDLRASNGTPVKAALGGTVKGVGNTDTVCPGASYGKWVLIEHGNGLSTLYAHLSLIRVENGQRVETGNIIGYSGDSGYATGPHLHFTVYATQGVRILERKSAVCRGTYTMPVADFKAYLNPLSYL